MDETGYNVVMDNWRFRADECAEIARDPQRSSDEQRRASALAAGYRAALQAAWSVMHETLRDPLRPTDNR